MAMVPAEELEGRYRSFDLNQAIGALGQCKLDLEVNEEEHSRLQSHFDFLRNNVIPRLMEGDNVETVTLKGIGRVHLRAELYARLNSGRKDEAYQWLRDNGHGGLVQSTVNASSLKAAIKEQIKTMKGEAFPEDLFPVVRLTQAVLTRQS